MKEKYKQAFMEMCVAFSQTSVAERLKVGAIIVKDDRIISLGINGTPTGWETNKCEDENGNTAKYVRHAEVQALNKLRKSHESSIGGVMFVTHGCCFQCALDIIDSGITTVYYKHDYRDMSGIDLLKKYGITVEKLS